jgi:carboxylesterase type B
VVKPGYRLNVLGFLASADVPGNFGFWDIRLALEWTYKNISYLGGNPRNITVGGYSAGAQAAFHQLSYDLVQPIEKRLIRRVIMHSNGPGLQPKSVKEAQTQFNELLSVIGIGKDAPNKMDLLRQTTAIELVKATQKMKFHQFRAVSDGEFVRKDLFAEITDGTFGKRLLENNVMLLIGECADEHFAYGRYKTPGPSYNALSARFQADYPKEAVKSIMKFYFPDQKLPARWKDWNEAFGKVYANMQIHVSERGFINGLVKGGATDLIDRYRIEWRAECADETSPRSFGATHGSDMPIWWYGDGRDLTFQEQSIVRKALLGNLAQFIAGKKMNWETNGPYQIRRFKADGSIDITTDPLWNEALEDWKSVGFGIVDLPIGKARF